MIFPNASFPVVSVIFFYLFLTSCLVELVFAFFEKEKWRVFAKPFPMLFLGLMAIFTKLDASYILLYVAIFCGMIGDILLTLKHKAELAFVIGAVFFLAGHVCYIIRMMMFLPDGNLSWIWSVAMLPVFYLALLLPCQKMTKRWGMTLLGALYLATLLSDVASGVILSANGYLWGILIIIGGCFFFSSDIYLSKTQFVEHDKREDFYIMLTYLLGQALIVVGILSLS